MKIQNVLATAAMVGLLATSTSSFANSDVPMGQGEGDVSLLPEDSTASDDLFGEEGGYFHPFVTLTGEYTDNLFNVDDNKRSNFLGKVTPGIWLSLPRTKEIPITITPHNSSAGGLQLQLKDYEGTDKYQVYALGGVDFKTYTEESDLNTMDAKAEGLARYNMASGLSLQVLDKYTLSHDRFEVGNANDDNLREYQSNIFMGTADWQLTEKLRLKGDYTNFILGYDDEINQFLDRTDNLIDLYGIFVYSLKTSFFLQYRFTDIKYDSDELRNNNQHNYYAGITWDSTEKLAFLFKAGYQTKQYDVDEINGYDTEYDGFVFDLQSTYRMTEKTSIVLDGYYKNEETDSFVALDKEVLGARLGYNQKFTDKITGLVDLTYEDANYNQLIEQDRDDQRIFIRPAVQYLFKEWLMAELAYSFEKRESTEDLFDYDTNTIFLNVNLAL